MGLKSSLILPRNALKCTNVCSSVILLLITSNLNRIISRTVFVPSPSVEGYFFLYKGNAVTLSTVSLSTRDTLYLSRVLLPGFPKPIRVSLFTVVSW